MSLPVCLCTSDSLKGINALFPSHLCSVLTNLCLQHWVALVSYSCFGYLASLALPYSGLLPIFPIASLPLSLAAFISPSSHRYSPKFHTCLFSFPLLALWVPRVSFSPCSNFLLPVDDSSNWYLCLPFPPGYLNSLTSLFPVPLILVMQQSSVKVAWVYKLKKCESQFWLSHLPALSLWTELYESQFPHL